MSARIEVSGELMMDPHSRVIGGVWLSGALRFAWYEGDGGERESFGCEVDSVEPVGLRH